MEVIARVEQKCGVEIKPRELLFQSLGQIAALCEERRSAPREPESSGFMDRVLQKFRAVVGMSRGDE